LTPDLSINLAHGFAPSVSPFGFFPDAPPDAAGCDLLVSYTERNWILVLKFVRIRRIYVSIMVRACAEVKLMIRFSGEFLPR
jgi:hypothetical protein